MSGLSMANITKFLSLKLVCILPVNLHADSSWYCFLQIRSLKLSFQSAKGLHSRAEMLPKGPQWRFKPWETDYLTKRPLVLYYWDPLNQYYMCLCLMDESTSHQCKFLIMQGQWCEYTQNGCNCSFTLVKVTWRSNTSRYNSFVRQDKYLCNDWWQSCPSFSYFAHQYRLCFLDGGFKPSLPSPRIATNSKIHWKGWQGTRHAGSSFDTWMPGFHHPAS